MNEILPLEKIRAILKDENWSEGAIRHDVSYHTIRKILAGEITNPRYETLLVLSKWAQEVGYDR